MVLPVSGFLPVPLPMMIPFMGAQSLVIGKMFGEGFQYGKRKISAMPNEEFNKLTFESLMSNAREEIKASVPTMNAAMQDMKPMVEVVVREFFEYVTLVTKIVTGTGEGENIFGKEGHDIGDWIKEQMGIAHVNDHDEFGNIIVGGGSGSVDVTPPPVKPPVKPPVEAPVEKRKLLKKLPSFTDWSLSKTTIIFITKNGMVMNKGEWEQFIMQKIRLHKRMLVKTYTFSYSKFRNGRQAIPKIQNTITHYRRILAGWNKLTDVAGQNKPSIGAIFR